MKNPRLNLQSKIQRKLKNKRLLWLIKKRNQNKMRLKLRLIQVMILITKKLIKLLRWSNNIVPNKRLLSQKPLNKALN